jgi:hypothetical protein
MAQPVDRRLASQVEAREEAAELGSAAARRHRLGEEDHWYRHGRLAEPKPPGNRSCQPRLHVQPPEERLRIRQLGLHLDDERNPESRMPAEEINAAALAVVAKGPLNPYLPAQTSQERSPRGLDRCMSAVQHAIKLSAAPLRTEVQADLKRRQAPAKRFERHAPDSSALEGGPRGSMDAGKARAVRLS